MLNSLPGNWAQVRAEDLNAELADGGELVLVDVRTVEEVAASGQLEGAVNIPLEKLLELRDQWPSQDSNIVAYSAEGYRGNVAMSIMRSFGYRNVRNLNGGLAAWQEAGYPVASD